MEGTGSDLEGLLNKEKWYYVRSTLVVLRVLFDTCLLVFALAWNAFDGWGEPWGQALDVLWFPSHLTTVAFDLSTHPTNFRFGEARKIFLDRGHIMGYRFAALWAFYVDFLLVFHTVRDIMHEPGDDRVYIERVCMAMSLSLTNAWRIAELFWNVKALTLSESAANKMVQVQPTSGRFTGTRMRKAGGGPRYAPLNTHDAAGHGSGNATHGCIRCKMNNQQATAALNAEAMICENKDGPLKRSLCPHHCDS